MDFSEVERGSDDLSSFNFLSQDSEGIKKVNLLDIYLTDHTPYKRNIYGGRSLGTSVTAEQLSEIDSGRFGGLNLGDYWEGANNQRWRIVDFNYFLNKSQANIQKNHVVIFSHIPYTNILLHNTNDLRNVGYANCDFRIGSNGNNRMEIIKSDIFSFFGEENIKTYGDYLCAGINNEGDCSSVLWCNCLIELLTISQVFGFSYLSKNTHIMNTDQFALFSLLPQCTHRRYDMLLRDINHGYCTRCDHNGVLTYTTATASENDAFVFFVLQKYQKED